MANMSANKPLATKIWTLPLAFTLALTGCGAAKTESSGSADSSTAEQATKAREAISNDVDGGHAIAASGETAAYEAVDVTKTGEADGDEADFYGANSAIYAENGATLDLDDITVNTNGTHANAIFSYGEGTTVNVSNSTIDTTGNCSGGLMVTGGGTLNATDLTIHTTGNSSAAIRSDRGGGTENVKGGTYTTDGMGSPVIYSTADVTVSDATLTSTSSQGVVVEGKNSVTLNNVDLTASNTSKNSDKSSYYQAVMIYQSMSGDAAQGEASFSMTDGTLTNKNGDVFFVNNTVATINLSKADIVNEDQAGVFLRSAAAGWGSEGSNGGHVTLKAADQTINGDMLVDDVSTLNLYLSEGSTFTGTINPDGAAGDVYVELAEGTKWVLTGDAHTSSLTCAADCIDLNGHTLYVGDTAYTEGTESSGEAIEVTITSTGGPGEMGGEPPAKPDGESGPQGVGGEPPAKPDGEGGSGQPPAMPDGEGGSGQPPAKPGSDS